MNIINNLAELKYYYQSRYGLNLLDTQFEIIESDKDFETVRFERYRQTGSTTALSIKALEFAINNQRSRVTIVCPFSAMALAHYSLIMNFLERKQLSRFLYNDNKQDRVITLINGSRIYFKSAAISDSLFGLRNDCVLVDCSNKIENKEVFDAIRSSLIASKKGQLILIDSKDFY